MRCFEKYHIRRVRIPRGMGLVKDQRGLSLIEVLISIAILGIIAVGFSNALGTSSRVLFSTDERETAKNLAESQMEYVTQQPYAISYSVAPIGSEYPNYSASITTANIDTRDSRIQKITVTISNNGEEITQLEGYKTR